MKPWSSSQTWMGLEALARMAFSLSLLSRALELRLLSPMASCSAKRSVRCMGVGRGELLHVATPATMLTLVGPCSRLQVQGTRGKLMGKLTLGAPSCATCR